MSKHGELAIHRQPHPAEQFDTIEQQREAGTLGMWIFLVTEVMFFGGLFVAYAVYRGTHPEVFIDAHQHLNKTLGMLNTLVLIFSSLTMAWAVRCAQLQQQWGLVLNLAITLVCAGLFLGVKAVEYSMKWDEGLLWAGAFAPNAAHEIGTGWSKSLTALASPALIGLPLAGVCGILGRKRSRRFSILSFTLAATCAAFLLGIATAKLLTAEAPHHTSATSHSELGSGTARGAGLTEPDHAPLTGVFFSIYFSMTGLHALHIVIGMGFLAWLVWTALERRYGPRYFAPVDCFGLYWHLVDLVWIFLFPLLYLIH